jgi:NAD(P)-dependent dehydrogenase (short-subunit alcohol dehydrogenase family)
MNRETATTASTVAIVLDGDTDAGYQLARSLMAAGRRVAVVARHPADVVRVMHGQSADRAMAIAADVDDPHQWSRVTERVMDRFGRIDSVVRAEDGKLRATA